MRNISAADANRHFSRLLRDVQAGETVTVTSRGMPVATIKPATSGGAEPKTARQALLARLQGQPAVGVTWNRDELYEDEVSA
ncbi:MAG: type II toxin-antitoxin system prevent-host-death family antitoxin [Rhodospirillaceae bacterium]|nr:type II toxin-antitoxin system prevent-host-death family antitoxin [Rhodospirillales bacterium]